MKIKSLFLAFTLALVSMAGTAHARKATDADKKMVRSVMKHLGQIADILGKNPKDSKSTLDTLEVYIDKNAPAMRALITKMSALEKELDADAKKELTAYVEKQPEAKKLQENAIAFAMAHQQDASVMERFSRIMTKLDPGSTEQSSAPPAPPAKKPSAPAKK